MPAGEKPRRQRKIGSAIASWSSEEAVFTWKFLKNQWVLAE